MRVELNPNGSGDVAIILAPIEARLMYSILCSVRGGRAGVFSSVAINKLNIRGVQCAHADYPGNPMLVTIERKSVFEDM